MKIIDKKINFIVDDPKLNSKFVFSKHNDFDINCNILTKKFYLDSHNYFPITEEYFSFLEVFTWGEKLKYKSACYENRTISEINESFTSKTCTRCGNIKNNLGANKHYNCKNCLLKIDRDVNGARNILLKFFSYYL